MNRFWKMWNISRKLWKIIEFLQNLDETIPNSEDKNSGYFQESKEKFS